MPIPANILIFRITHRDNLEHIFSTQLICSPNHEGRSPNYISIGETELIRLRSACPLPIEPGGSFRDYVSFYLGPRPVMLYAIKNGFNVTRVPQQEIIYLVTSFSKIQELGCTYVFSDGHGYAAITRWFNNPDGFEELDWDMIYANQWYDTEEDSDRKRRKQAEFLVDNELTLRAIEKIVVYNQNSLDFVNNLLRTYSDIDYISTEIDAAYYY